MNTNEYEGGIQVKKWARALYQPNLPLEENHRVTACEEHIRLSKEAATEGMVLLKNEKNLLPLAKGTRLALFGKGTPCCGVKASSNEVSLKKVFAL